MLSSGGRERYKERENRDTFYLKFNSNSKFVEIVQQWLRKLRMGSL